MIVFTNLHIDYIYSRTFELNIKYKNKIQQNKNSRHLCINTKIEQ